MRGLRYGDGPVSLRLDPKTWAGFIRTREILARIPDIVLRGFANPREFLLGHRTFDLGRRAQDETLGWDDRIFRDQCSGTNDRVFPDHRAVHDDGAHSDQHPVLNGAAVQHDIVTDSHVVANDEGMRVVVNMQHAEVLHVGSVSNADVIHIAADDGMEPGAAVFAHHDVADDDRGVFDKAGLRDGGPDALESPNHPPNLG